MTDQEVLRTFGRILGDLLSSDPVPLTMETRRQDVPGWDSFAYINFIVAVEQELGVRFGVAEVESFENVGAILRRARALMP
ncbi:MAG TPA: acyl carrier protein [Gemmatimonadales bacterium]|nr:acyl carrier protein [Gemmatimonadales bacterium]